MALYREQRYASVKRESPEASARALEALEAHLDELEYRAGKAPPVSVTARLLVLPHLDPGQRVAYCGRGLAELQDPADAVRRTPPVTHDSTARRQLGEQRVCGSTWKT